MTSLLFRNARVFDGQSADAAGGMSVLVEDGLIREVSSKKVNAKNARGQTALSQLDGKTMAVRSPDRASRGPRETTVELLRKLGGAP